MERRFFSEQPVSGDSIQLEGAEANHIVKVMRAKIGDCITVFDGSGFEFNAEITELARSSVTLHVRQKHQVSREPIRQLVLGVALPKGDRQRTMIEKCVELGVARLVPLITSRSVALPKEAALERARRNVIEASKQCGRNILMEVSEPATFADFIAQADSNGVRWLAHPSQAAPAPAQPFSQLTIDQGSELIFAAIGPEGGFDETEVELATNAGWQRVSLGHSILRVETAALALAAFWLADPSG